MPDDQFSGSNAPWRWPEEKWRGVVNKVRAGRSLKPKNSIGSTQAGSKKANVLISMLSRGAAFGGDPGSGKEVWAVKRARPSFSES